MMTDKRYTEGTEPRLMLLSKIGGGIIVGVKKQIRQGWTVSNDKSID